MPFLRRHCSASRLRSALAALLLSAALVSEVARAAEPRPNFIVINIDDLGYGDIGPFGSTLNRTPNLDRMAAEGRRLTSFYAAPVCSPSRAALMTGCYPKRALPIPHVLFPANVEGLHPDEVTIAELLRAAGYSTGMVGKWHLGDQPEFLPTRQGFDSFFGLPYSNDMGPAADGVKSNLGDPLPQQKDDAKGQPPLPWLRNETVVKRVLADDQTTLVARYTEEAVAFLRGHKDGTPFFLYLPHSAVHFPIYPGKAFQGKSQNGIYGDWVEEVDWSVGKVLDTVRELGLEERTLVLFTSDNGGTRRAINAPFRGFKGSTWEGGMRVPAIAWWPGKIPAGTDSDAITGMIDVMPTLVGLAGGQAPQDRVIDGRDLWPVLAGEETATLPHDTFFYYRGLKLEAVRSGPWKLHLANGKLFQLGDDPGESTDIAAEHPDVVERLRALAAAMGDDLGLDGIGPGCRALGKAADPRPIIDHDGTVREEFRQREPVPEALNGSRREVFKVVGNAELALHIFEPEGHTPADRRPAAVFFFGGGWNGGTPAQFAPHCRYLASRGMVAAAAEYRVASRHGATPFECVEDAKSAVRWLRGNAGRLGIDPGKIAAGGGSAGGHLAAAAATVPGLDDAGEDATVSPVPDALLLFNPVYDNGPGGYGHDRVGDRFAEISPLHNIRPGMPPAVVFLGTEDRLIPVNTAREFQRRMREAGSRSDLHLYEGQPHGFFNSPEFRPGTAPEFYRQTLLETGRFLASLGFLQGEPTLE